MQSKHGTQQEELLTNVNVFQIDLILSFCLKNGIVSKLKMDNEDVRLPPLFGPKNPKLKAIIYSEFDNVKGPVLRFQVSYLDFLNYTSYF